MVGTRHLHPKTLSPRGMRVIAVAVPHEKGPWETIFVNEAAGMGDALLVAAAPDLLRELEVCAALVCRIICGTNKASSGAPWHCPECQFAHAALRKVRDNSSSD